ARGAHAGPRERPADLEGMRGLYALLAALERDRANALVAFGEAAMLKGDRELVLALRGAEADLAHASVVLFDRRIQPLIDLVGVRLAADRRAIELLAVE